MKDRANVEQSYAKELRCAGIMHSVVCVGILFDTSEVIVHNK